MEQHGVPRSGLPVRPTLGTETILGPNRWPDVDLALKRGPMGPLLPRRLPAPRSTSCKDPPFFSGDPF